MPELTQVILPELGEGIEDATVAHWYSEVNDQVNEGDDLVELVTDKASFVVGSTAKGILQEVCFPIGNKVKVGGALAVIRTAD